MYNPEERYQVHWIVILQNGIQILKAFIPLLLIFVVNAMRDGVGAFFMLLIPIGFFSIYLILAGLIGFIQWKKFTYWFEEDELRIEYGVFVKKKRYIPFERIQSLDFTESILHRPFKLVKIKIETAGGSGEAEATLGAVSRNAARVIEHIIQEGKKKKVQEIHPMPLQETDIPLILGQRKKETPRKQEEVQPVYKMSIKDLIVLATTSGGIGIIIGGALLFLTQFTDVIPFEAIYQQFSNFVKAGVVFVLVVVLVVLLIAWVLSVVWTIISYYRFEVTRDRENLFIARGLLEKKRLTVPLQRVQSVQVIENPFRQLFGYCKVVVHSAGGDMESSQINLFPLIKKREIKPLMADIFEDLIVDEPTQRVPRRGRHFNYRINYMWSLPFVVGWSYFLYPWGLLTLLLIPFIIALGIWQHYSARFEWGEHQVTTRHRKFSLFTTYLKKNRIQSMTVRQSYFHKKKKVAKVFFYFKSGMSARAGEIPFVEEETADALMDWYEK